MIDREDMRPDSYECKFKNKCMYLEFGVNWKTNRTCYLLDLRLPHCKINIMWDFTDKKLFNYGDYYHAYL